MISVVTVSSLAVGRSETGAVGVVRRSSIARRDRGTPTPLREVDTLVVRVSGRRRRRDAMRISSIASRLRGKGVRDQRAQGEEGARGGPLKYLPNFITSGKGIFDVKLKHIVSKINLSIASNLCLSDSKACRATLVKLDRMRGRLQETDLRIHVDFPNERPGLEGFLGKSNGVGSRQDVFRFLEGVVHLR
jgi:hypothetical protein